MNRLRGALAGLLLPMTAIAQNPSNTFFVIRTDSTFDRFRQEMPLVRLVVAKPGNTPRALGQVLPTTGSEVTLYAWYHPCEFVSNPYRIQVTVPRSSLGTDEVQLVEAGDFVDILEHSTRSQGSVEHGQITTSYTAAAPRGGKSIVLMYKLDSAQIDDILLNPAAELRILHKLVFRLTGDSRAAIAALKRSAAKYPHRRCT